MERQWGLGSVLAVVLVIVLLVVGGLIYVKSSDNSSPTPGGSGGMPIYMDGWSMANTNQTSLSVGATGDGGSPVWRPADGSDIKSLLQKAPKLLQAVAGRMISPAAKVSCTSAGCSEPGGSIPNDWFVNATNIPGLGKEYAAYGITHTLWVSSAQVARGAPLTLRYGSSSVEVLGSSKGPGTSVDGYNAGVALVFSGFGSIFLPGEAWQETPPAPYYYSTTPSTVAGSVSVGPAATGGSLFSGGLGQFYPEAVGLDDTELSYMTSPSTGCGAGVLCVPGGGSGASVAGVSSSTGNACNGSLTVKMIYVTANWSYNYAKPTNQAGVWGGKAPDQFVGTSGPDKLFWTGQPPLVQGKATLHEQLAYATESTRSTLIAVGGRVGESGVDTGDAVSGVAGPALLGSVLGAGWVAC